MPGLTMVPVRGGTPPWPFIGDMIMLEGMQPGFRVWKLRLYSYSSWDVPTHTVIDVLYLAVGTCTVIIQWSQLSIVVSL